MPWARRLLVAALALCAAGSGAAAERTDEVFVTTGAHGEASFSDVAGPGARRLSYTHAVPAADALAEVERRIAQTLTVADALERSRLAREQARAEAAALSRRSAAATDKPDDEAHEQYLPFPYVYRPDPWRSPHHRPPWHPHDPPWDDVDGDPPPERTLTAPLLRSRDGRD